MALSRLSLSRSTLDRAAHLRSDPELVTKLAADPQTRVVPISAGRAPTVEGPTGPRLLVSEPAEWPDLVERREPVFLGLDEQGIAYLAFALPGDPPELDGVTWAGLREVGTLLDDTGVGVLTASVALLGWHAGHPHCARCGHATDLSLAGWERRCPACGATHYPRTDPAVIMSIVDDEGRILLGRQAVWPPLRFSTLAGFVEPGESLEDAVRREVGEEAGIGVGAVNYLGSQPWPFPSSLMLGFEGRATSTEITVDGAELAEARWWSREQLADDVGSGALLLPPGLSIARRLIEHWFGAPIPAPDLWR